MFVFGNYVARFLARRIAEQRDQRTALIRGEFSQWPTLYIRGVRGLRAELERIGKLTLSNLEYVGEWHSHPPKCAPKPSSTDQRALTALAEQMAGTGLPAVMLIVAERNRQGFFLR